MSTWKRILTEDDGNLATTNLTQSSGNRSYTVSGAGSRLTFSSHDGTGMLQLNSGSSGVSTESVSIQTPTLFLSNPVTSASAEISFREATNNGSNAVTLAAPTSLSGNLKFTLPSSDGSSGEVLQTDGNGNLSFAAGGGGTIGGSGGANRMAIWSNSNTLTSDAEITYTSATHLITAGALTAQAVTGVANTGLVTSDQLSSKEILVSSVSVNTAGAFGIGARILTKAGSFTGTLTAGRIMRYSQGQGTNPITTADNTSAASATTMLFCTTDAVSPQELLLEGAIKMATSQGFASAAQGTPVYLHSTNGIATSTPPTTSGSYSRIVGYVLDASNGIIYFSPDRSWVKIA